MTGPGGAPANAAEAEAVEREVGHRITPSAQFLDRVAQVRVALVERVTAAPSDVLLSQHLAATVGCASEHFAQAAFTLACLPYEAFFSLDAIMRTAGRMLVTHRRLLEWIPSGDRNGNSRTDLAGFCRTMWIAPAVATAAVIRLLLSRPAELGMAGPILGLWFASPVIAWWISRPLARRAARLTASQSVFLRKLSRKTWRYFETFVGPEDHWLPPDNYQEHPVARLGHRTSPTNMGLALLANLSACDFGYISAGQLIERTANALRRRSRRLVATNLAVENVLPKPKIPALLRKRATLRHASMALRALVVFAQAVH